MSEGLTVSLSNGLRGLLWRAGRKLYCYARGDLPNQPETNGEYWLIEQFLSDGKGELLAFDVGANKGDWTVHVLDRAAKLGRKVAIHSFEPSSATRALLTARLAGRSSVTIDATAISSSVGEVYFYSNETGAGTNSLSAVSGDRRELVQTSTLDAFLEKAGIEHLGMLKIDTEGFDFEVLRGAAKTLAAGAIDLVQFEYNWRWLINHVALRDVFAFLEGKPYRLGKLVGSSIELFDAWHFELDRYFENNYVLIKDGSPLLDRVNFVRFDGANCAVRTGRPAA